jgi:hypothetical protein
MGSGVEMPEDTYELLPQQESLLGTGLRNVARLGARAVESAAGLPGNIESLGRGLVNVGSRAITGKEAVSPQTLLPTSQNIRQLGKVPGSNYLEPQGNLEELSDEIVGDLTSFLVPIPGVTQGTNIKRAAKLAGLSNLAGFATKKVTGSEGLGDVVKMGSLLVPAFFGLPKARDLMRTAYDDAYKALPQDATVSAKGIKPKLDKISELISHGISTPENQELANLITDVESKIQGGVMPLRSADAIKKQLNGMIYGGKYGDKSALQGIEKLLPTVTHSLNEAINDYAKTNPSFGAPYQQANELFAAINGGPKIVRWIEKHITPDKAIYSLMASLIKGYGPAGAATTAAVLSLPPALRSGTILLKSPTIRNNLLSALKAAAAEDAAAFARATNKMEREVVRENPEWYSAKPDDLYEIIK